jgi:hypothetical protein
VRRPRTSGGRERRESLASFTEGHEQARSQGRTGTREGVEERVVGELGAERRYLRIEAFNGGVHGTELRDGGLDEQQQRPDDGGVASNAVSSDSAIRCRVRR